VQSEKPERVKALVDEYAVRFAEAYLAVEPVPERPTA
jgi:hypothetical protein